MINWNKYLNLSSPRNIKLLVCFALAFLFLGLFLKITVQLLEDKNFTSFDVPILQFIDRNVRTPVLNGVAVDITALGSASLISLFTIIGLVSLLIQKDKLGALFLACNVIGATLWMAAFKNAIGRERPHVIPRLVEVSDFSYPSGHSLVSTATYLAMAFLVCRHLRSLKLISMVLAFTCLLILSIAFSRLYLGVHYPSDVISGMLFGLSWVLGMTVVFKIYQTRHFHSGN